MSEEQSSNEATFALLKKTTNTDPQLHSQATGQFADKEGESQAKAERGFSFK
jgi:hypothetical protein